MDATRYVEHTRSGPVDTVTLRRPGVSETVGALLAGGAGAPRRVKVFLEKRAARRVALRDV